MKDIRQTIKNEIRLRNNILNLHEKGLISQLDVHVYLSRIQDSNNHEQVLDELDKVIKLVSCIFEPLESKNNLYDILVE